MADRKAIGKAVRKAQRDGAKKKKTDDAPAGIHPPECGWKGDVRTVPAGDLGLLRVGVDLAGKAAKNAERLNGALEIAKGKAAERATEAAGLLSLIDDLDNRQDLQIPPHLLTVAQVGVRLEYGQVKKSKTAQLTLEIRDTKALDKRLRELDRLAELLGVQGSLNIEEKDDDEGEGE